MGEGEAEGKRERDPNFLTLSSTSLFLESLAKII